MSEKALILSADKWEMPDERTGELRRGVSVTFINEYREAGEGSLGFKPTKISATPEMWSVLSASSLPALFELDFGSRPGKDLKPTLTLVGAKMVQPLNVFGSKATAKAA